MIVLHRLHPHGTIDSRVRRGERWRGREPEKDRQIERETHTEGLREKKVERERERQTERLREKKVDRERERQTERLREKKS